MQAEDNNVMPKPINNPITIHGLIIPVDWDEKGNAIAISVSTYDEEEYLIEKDEIGEGLISFLRQEIEINGLYRLEDGRKIIEVKGYTIKRFSSDS